MPIACCWKVESPARLRSPTVADPSRINVDIAKTLSPSPQLNGRPCQPASPRQKLAIKFDQNSQRPRSVKIGCRHQSSNGFLVQPSKVIFAVDPVGSPNWYFVHTIQLTIGTAAQTMSTLSATSPVRGIHRTISSSTPIRNSTRSGAIMRAALYPIQTTIAISGTFRNRIQYNDRIPANPIFLPIR